MFSQLTRYASGLDVQIDDANMDIRISYDTCGKLLLEDVSPAAEQVEYVLETDNPLPSDKVRKMVLLIEKGCHTINTLREPIAITATLKHNGAEVELYSPRPWHGRVRRERCSSQALFIPPRLLLGVAWGVIGKKSAERIPPAGGMGVSPVRPPLPGKEGGKGIVETPS